MAEMWCHDIAFHSFELLYDPMAKVAHVIYNRTIVTYEIVNVILAKLSFTRDKLSTICIIPRSGNLI